MRKKYRCIDLIAKFKEESDVAQVSVLGLLLFRTTIKQHLT